MTWQNGRQLATYSQGNTYVNYTYDVSGMRTSKTVTQNGTATEYNYVYENGLLLQMTRGSRVYDFIKNFRLHRYYTKGAENTCFSPFFSKEKSLETRINTAFFKTFRWSA